jgi:hypothetical protein
VGDHPLMVKLNGLPLYGFMKSHTRGLYDEGIIL